MDALRDAIARRFEGSRARGVRARIHAAGAGDDMWDRARLEMAPAARVAVELPCTDGFKLTLRWSDRGDGRGGRAPLASMFDDSFLVETNDLALAGVWLDHASREELPASRYVAATNPDRQTAPLPRRRVDARSLERRGLRVPPRQRAERRPHGRHAAGLAHAGEPARALSARAFRKVAGALGGGEIAFDGALADRVRLGAAIELAAWWAAGTAAAATAGPYR